MPLVSFYTLENMQSRSFLIFPGRKVYGKKLTLNKLNVFLLRFQVRSNLHCRASSSLETHSMLGFRAKACNTRIHVAFIF